MQVKNARIWRVVALLGVLAALAFGVVSYGRPNIGYDMNRTNPNVHYDMSGQAAPNVLHDM